VRLVPIYESSALQARERTVWTSAGPGRPRARCAVEKLQRESPESERQRGGLLCTPAVVSPRLSHSGLSRRSALSGPPVRGNTATMSSHLLC